MVLYSEVGGGVPPPSRVPPPRQLRRGSAHRLLGTWRPKYTACCMGHGWRLVEHGGATAPQCTDADPARLTLRGNIINSYSYARATMVRRVASSIMIPFPPTITLRTHAVRLYGLRCIWCTQCTRCTRCRTVYVYGVRSPSCWPVVAARWSSVQLPARSEVSVAPPVRDCRSPSP